MVTINDARGLWHLEESGYWACGLGSKHVRSFPGLGKCFVYPIASFVSSVSSGPISCMLFVFNPTSVLCPTLLLSTGHRRNFRSLFLFQHFRKTMKKPRGLQKKGSWPLGTCYSPTGSTATITKYSRSVILLGRGPPDRTPGLRGLLRGVQRVSLQNPG